MGTQESIKLASRHHILHEKQSLSLAAEFLKLESKTMTAPESTSAKQLRTYAKALQNNINVFQNYLRQFEDVEPTALIDKFRTTPIEIGERRITLTLDDAPVFLSPLIDSTDKNMPDICRLKFALIRAYARYYMPKIQQREFVDIKHITNADELAYCLQFFNWASSAENKLTWHTYNAGDNINADLAKHQALEFSGIRFKEAEALTEENSQIFWGKQGPSLIKFNRCSFAENINGNNQIVDVWLSGLKNRDKPSENKKILFFSDIKVNQGFIDMLTALMPAAQRCHLHFAKLDFQGKRIWQEKFAAVFSKRNCPNLASVTFYDSLVAEHVTIYGVGPSLTEKRHYSDSQLYLMLNGLMLKNPTISQLNISNVHVANKEQRIADENLWMTLCENKQIYAPCIIELTHTQYETPQSKYYADPVRHNSFDTFQEIINGPLMTYGIKVSPLKKMTLAQLNQQFMRDLIKFYSSQHISAADMNCVYNSLLLRLSNVLNAYEYSSIETVEQLIAALFVSLCKFIFLLVYPGDNIQELVTMTPTQSTMRTAEYKLLQRIMEADSYNLKQLDNIITAYGKDLGQEKPPGFFSMLSDRRRPKSEIILQKKIFELKEKIQNYIKMIALNKAKHVREILAINDALADFSSVLENNIEVFKRRGEDENSQNIQSNRQLIQDIKNLAEYHQAKMKLIPCHLKMKSFQFNSESLIIKGYHDKQQIIYFRDLSEVMQTLVAIAPNKMQQIQTLLQQVLKKLGQDDIAETIQSNSTEKQETTSSKAETTEGSLQRREIAEPVYTDLASHNLYADPQGTISTTAVVVAEPPPPFNPAVADTLEGEKKKEFEAWRRKKESNQSATPLTFSSALFPAAESGKNTGVPLRNKDGEVDVHVFPTAPRF